MVRHVLCVWRDHNSKADIRSHVINISDNSDGITTRIGYIDYIIDYITCIESDGHEYFYVAPEKIEDIQTLVPKDTAIKIRGSFEEIYKMWHDASFGLTLKEYCNRLNVII